jgi:hypothetical protein
MSQDVGLPIRPFLYTLDQVATLLGLEVRVLKDKYIHFDDRSLGVHHRDTLLARNIAPSGETPEWRVAEKEFTRWLRHKRFRIYERAWVSS